MSDAMRKLLRPFMAGDNDAHTENKCSRSLAQAVCGDRRGSHSATPPLQAKQFPYDPWGGMTSLSAAAVLTILVRGAWRGLKDKAKVYLYVQTSHWQDFPTLGAYRWNGPSLCRKSRRTEEQGSSTKGGSSMHVTTVGIDLAKQMFHVHGTDAQGREVFRKRLSRPALIPGHLTALPHRDEGVRWSALLGARSRTVRISSTPDQSPLR